MTFKIFADGGCAPTNPGPGGFAFRIESTAAPVEGWGFEPDATNNRMELLAAIHGLRSVPVGSTVELICDSEYVLNGCSKWRTGWQSRGMKKSGGGEVLNAELWLQLWQEVDARKVSYRWVKGHSGNPGNERVDFLVGVARQRQETVLPEQFKCGAAQVLTSAEVSPSAEKALSSESAVSQQIHEPLVMALLSMRVGPLLRPGAVLDYKALAQEVLAMAVRPVRTGGDA